MRKYGACLWSEIIQDTCTFRTSKEKHCRTACLNLQATDPKYVCTCVLKSNKSDPPLAQLNSVKRSYSNASKISFSDRDSPQSVQSTTPTLSNESLRDWLLSWETTHDLNPLFPFSPATWEIRQTPGAKSNLFDSPNARSQSEIPSSRIPKSFCNRDPEIVLQHQPHCRVQD
jgi:hypothetical protein